MGVLIGDHVGDLVDRMDLVDHHCHGVSTIDLDDPGVEAMLGEGGPPPAGRTNFDSPVGLAVRRHCAPVLDLDPHVSRRDYLDRRRELGPAELARRFLAPTGTSRFCVDTGFRPDGLTTPEELAAFAGGRGHARGPAGDGGRGAGGRGRRAGRAGPALPGAARRGRPRRSARSG